MVWLHRLSNLFHGMDENTPVRYTVFCSLIKVAATCNAISFIPTDLDQVYLHIMINWDNGFKKLPICLLHFSCFTCFICFSFLCSWLMICLCCFSGAQVDYRLEPEHREEAHTLEAGVWSIGGLQKKVTTYWDRCVKFMFWYVQKQKFDYTVFKIYKFLHEIIICSNNVNFYAYAHLWA